MRRADVRRRPHTRESEVGHFRTVRLREQNVGRFYVAVDDRPIRVQMQVRQRMRNVDGDVEPHAHVQGLPVSAFQVLAEVAVRDVLHHQDALTPFFRVPEQLHEVQMINLSDRIQVKLTVDQLAEPEEEIKQRRTSYKNRGGTRETLT